MEMGLPDNNEAFGGLGKEEWASVLGYVTDSRDKWACFHVCELWKNILEPTKPQWQWGLVLHYVYGHLTTDNQLRNARLVCKSWNKAIQTFEWTGNREEDDPFLKVWYSGCINTFISIGCLDRFIKRFGGDPDDVNDFHKSASFPPSISNPEEYANYMQRMISFIQTFGKYLNEVYIHDNFSIRTHHYYAAVQKGLCSLPNLETLSLFCKKQFNETDSDPDPIYEEALQQYILHHPLPALDQLREIKIYGKFDTFEKILYAKYAPQLTSVRCASPLPSEDHFKNTRSLEKLQFRALWSDCLESLSVLQSPLRRIEILFYKVEDIRWWHVDTFLKAVKHLPLETLKFNTDHVIIAEYRIINKEEIQLPTVKKVEFVGGSTQFSFNFLQCFPNLEEVFVYYSAQNLTHMQSSPPYNIPETVKLHRFLYEDEKYKKIYRFSNVWELLPSLQRIDLNWIVKPLGLKLHRIFTRRQYQNIQAKFATNPKIN